MNSICQGIGNVAVACVRGTIGAPLQLYDAVKVLSESSDHFVRQQAKVHVKGAVAGLCGMVAAGLGVAILKTLFVAGMAGLITGLSLTGVGALCLVVSIAIVYSIRGYLSHMHSAHKGDFDGQTIVGPSKPAVVNYEEEGSLVNDSDGYEGRVDRINPEDDFQGEIEREYSGCSGAREGRFLSDASRLSDDD